MTNRDVAQPAGAGAELEACPFHKPELNGPTEVVSEWYSGQRIAFWAAHCEACLARGPEESTKEEAIEAWNTRAPSPDVWERARRVALRVQAWLREDGELGRDVVSELAAIIAAEFGGGGEGMTE